MSDISELREQLQGEIRAKGKCLTMYRWMDKAFRSIFELPKPLSEWKWMRTIISTDPYQALRTGTQVLSAAFPLIRVNPMSYEPLAKEWANTAECVARWEWYRAGQRNPSSLIASIVDSWLRYDEACVQVIHVPTQMKAIGNFDGPRSQIAEAFGDFVLRVENPQNVFAVYSDYGLEAVYALKQKTGKAVKSFWGKLADKVKSDDDYIEVNYWDWTNQAVWCETGNLNAIMEDNETPVGKVNVSEGTSSKRPIFGHSDQIVIMPKSAHGLGFLPWSCLTGGNTLDTEEEFRRVPMLFPVYQAKQWATQNVMSTVAFSNAMAQMGAVRGVVTGPNAKEEVANLDGMENPTHTVGLESGTYTPVPPPQLDSALIELANYLSQSMKKSTVPESLQNVMPPAGMSYSAVNLITTSALNVLNPYKNGAQRTIADATEIMFKFCWHKGATLKAYGIKNEDWGTPYEVKPTDVDTKRICVDVEIRPTVPTDDMQKANTGSILVSQLGWSKASAAKLLGEENWEGIQRERTDEIMYEAFLGQQVDKIKREVEMAFQKGLLTFQAELQQKVQAAAQEAASQTPPEQPAAGTPQGMQGATNGQGFNPAASGTPPAQGAPGMGTFEQSTGGPRQPG